MGRAKTSLAQHFENRFWSEATIVCLLSFVILELFSCMGWLAGVTSIFAYPTDRIMQAAILLLGVSGAFGLFKSNKFGAYFALLTSVFEIVLGFFSVLKVSYTAELNLALAASAVAGSVLGFVTLYFVFRTGVYQQDRTHLEPGDSTSTNPGSHYGKADSYAIEAIDATKKYVLEPNVVSAVNGLTMRVRKGEFFAIMGPSGSGKSTLLNLIGALDKPSSGSILIDGVDIAMLDEDSLAKLRNEKIGFVFQAYNLIARSSVLRNMELPALVKGFTKEERLQRVDQLLSTVGLGDKAPRKPQTLSGGEQQRVAIARALINDPEIVLADEPTGNVDSATGQVIMNFLKKLNVENGTTVIVVTHDPEVAKMADRIIHIKDGAIVKEKKTAT